MSSVMPFLWVKDSKWMKWLCLNKTLLKKWSKVEDFVCKRMQTHRKNFPRFCGLMTSVQSNWAIVINLWNGIAQGQYLAVFLSLRKDNKSFQWDLSNGIFCFTFHYGRCQTHSSTAIALTLVDLSAYGQFCLVSVPSHSHLFEESPSCYI